MVDTKLSPFLFFAEYYYTRTRTRAIWWTHQAGMDSRRPDTLPPQHLGRNALPASQLGGGRIRHLADAYYNYGLGGGLRHHDALAVSH